MSTDNVIKVRGLVRRYGDLVALDRVDFTVRRGEIFAYLGPNGAGKTTTINILAGLLHRDAGEVSICGFDIEREPVAVKQRIGVVPEESNLYPELTCRRNLEYLGQLYGLGRYERRRRVDELLETFDLTEKSAVRFRALSRGMKRRLTVAASLVHNPEVVFFDEPTTGLDVPSARTLRELIRTINRRGTTVFLTTHNLAEAEALSDRVLILIKGKVVTEGATDEIGRQAAGAEILSVVFSANIPVETLRAVCPAVTSANITDEKWRFEVANVHQATMQIIAWAEKSGLTILKISTETPSLEEAFMAILEKNSAGSEVRR